MFGDNRCDKPGCDVEYALDSDARLYLEPDPDRPLNPELTRTAIYAAPDPTRVNYFVRMRCKGGCPPQPRPPLTRPRC